MTKKREEEKKYTRGIAAWRKAITITLPRVSAKDNCKSRARLETNANPIRREGSLRNPKETSGYF